MVRAGVPPAICRSKIRCHIHGDVVPAFLHILRDSDAYYRGMLADSMQILDRTLEAYQAAPPPELVLYLSNPLTR